MKAKSPERIRLDSERTAAAKYFVRNFSREKRYLIIFARDFKIYLQSANWLQSDDAKGIQKFWDFLADYKSLRKKMQEFSWSKDFLLANGIDFKEIKKLYHKVSVC
jgi:hypothetical protein